MTFRRPWRVGRRPAVASALAVLLAAGIACASSGNGGPSLSERATGLAQTGAAVLTGTAAAAVTVSSATPEPSATETVIPTAEPTATNTATAIPTITPVATPCPGDDSDFVTDVTIPDGTHFAPGSAFNKTWRLRNGGPCTWNSDYEIRFTTGEVMAGVSTRLPGVVAPGATVDITVALIAPAAAGTYRGNWRLFAPGGTAFGTEPYVEIRVP
jgi:hypothetical protein